MQQFQTLRRLLYFYILTLLIMLVLYYTMMFSALKTNSQQHSQIVFDTLQREVTEYVVPTDNEIAKILAKPFFQDISYQLILMLPSGKTYVHRYTHPYDRQFAAVTFPNISSQNNNTLQNANVTSSYELTKRNLTAIIKLKSGHQIYVVLHHQPLKINWTSYQFWLPLMTAFVLFIMVLLYMLKRHANWEQLLHYVENLTTAAKENYVPPPFVETAATPEFLRLGHSLSRVSYQLHKYHRRNKTLKHRLERLVDQAPLPMLMIMRQGQISFFNRRFEQVFNTLFQRDINYVLTDFIAGSDTATQQLLQELSSQRVTRTLLVYGLESKQAHQLHITPWFGEHGQVHGFTVLLNNVNKLIQQAESLQLKNERLQMQIKEFNKLRSIIGHELRTPLNAIIGTLDLIESDHLSPKQQEVFSTLTQSSQSMLAMLNDMLDMAKIEAGKTHIVDEATDIFKIGKHITNLMVGSARQQEISLMYFFAPDCPRYINTDSGRMRQILLNLLDNAIKFTSSGYVALIVEPITHEKMLRIQKNEPVNTIKVNNSSASYPMSINASTRRLQHQWIRFSVKDTGIGIVEAEQQKLFSYFNQANDQISQDFGGTGLGLAISSSFAQLLGGFINLDSDGQSGSTFSLYLPCRAPTYQPVYHFHSSFTHIRLIAIVKQQLCATFLQRICAHLSLPIYVYTYLDSSAAQQLHKQLTQDSQQLAPVLLLDYEYYETHPEADTKPPTVTSTPTCKLATKDDAVMNEVKNSNTINDLLNDTSLPKILMSIKSESNIPSTLLDQFDGFLNKPLDIALLLSELMRLTQSVSKAKKVQPIIKGDRVESTKELYLATKMTSSKESSFDNSLTAPLILVVDDNITNQKITCKLLERLGYRSVVADNGHQALDRLALQRQEIVLILMDCRMPVMDGLQATQAIRAQGDDIPIVALTANNTEEDRETCHSVGMNEFLAKPISKDKLQAVLQQLTTA